MNRNGCRARCCEVYRFSPRRRPGFAQTRRENSRGKGAPFPPCPPVSNPFPHERAILVHQHREPGRGIARMVHGVAFCSRKHAEKERTNGGVSRRQGRYVKNKGTEKVMGLRGSKAGRQASRLTPRVLFSGCNTMEQQKNGGTDRERGLGMPQAAVDSLARSPLLKKDHTRNKTTQPWTNVRVAHRASRSAVHPPGSRRTGLTITCYHDLGALLHRATIKSASKAGQ